MGGRGSGKTRAGAEWVRAMALGDTHFCSSPAGRIALVGGSYHEVRDVMIEGNSGILGVHTRRDRPDWNPSRRQLRWANGSIAQAYSAQEPETLRGPQFAAAWCDEIAKWTNGQATWDMLQFCLRIGSAPRQVVTTTPKPVKVLKRILAEAGTIISRSRTADNRSNLAAGFFERLLKVYDGTRLARQELDGELIEDRADALWQRSAISTSRVASAPALERIVVAVDPPVTANENSDACGIVVAGRSGDGRFYVLADGTIEAASPLTWANAAVELFDKFEADCMVAETNQGGDLVETVIRQIRRDLPLRQVRATRGKWVRAEPVASLYERGLVHHVASMPGLEDQMCDFGPGGLSDGSSPDRMDALVWAITELMVGAGRNPRVRGT